MLKTRIIAFALIIAGGFIGYFTATNGAYRFGLDLSGGTHLVYKADTSNLAQGDVKDAMESLRDTIERRVNLFGVAEPIVQTEVDSFAQDGDQNRLIVEMPGIEDTAAAVEMIGKTPVLEFRMQKEGATDVSVGTVDENGELVITTDDLYEKAVLTGAHLKNATLQFGGSQGALSNEPMVILQFDDEGAQIFEDMTSANVGKTFGIFLDGTPISIPVIREAIPGGSAVISGNFTPEEARTLVRDLNFGALPVPIDLLSSQTIGASLGSAVLGSGIVAGLWGLALVALFMVLWYRLPGLVALVSLSIYIVLMLAVFKFMGVTLTAAGIAGFILSIGMAVDANVLIFERMKEELAEGKWTHNAIKDGFARAWLSIRDGNLSSIITAVILFWFGTSMVEGFALVFGLGVLISMFTAISVTRTLLLALGDYENKGVAQFLFGHGVK